MLRFHLFIYLVCPLLRIEVCWIRFWATFNFSTGMLNGFVHPVDFMYRAVVQIAASITTHKERF